LTRGSPAERTAEERERARLERARRRAEREGLPLPPSVESNGAAEVEPQPVEEPPPPPPPERAAPEPLVAEAPAIEEPAQIAAQPVEPPPPAMPEPPAAEAPSTEELAPVEPVELPPDPEPGPEPEPEPEPPLARAPEPPPVAPRRPPVPTGERLPPLPAAARAPLAPRERSHRARIGAIVALALVIAAAIVLLLISSSGGKSKPGAAAPPVVHVLIPEGQTRLQIAETAAREGLAGSYRAASKHSPLLSPVRYGAPAGTPDLEGFLFPATYDLYPKAPVARLVEEQLVAFKENFGAQQIARAKALHITPYELLTVASMVEREAQVPGDRAKIAAVIYNRLRRGMPLGIDATLYYAIEMRENIPTYTKELSAAQLQMGSRYNTRTHPGLPPTPIANPGVASIEAAGAPANVPYLYYVLGADGCGEHVFSTSEAQFQANDAAYQAALSKNGGHLPACSKK
jgi:UPF0755 protein